MENIVMVPLFPMPIFQKFHGFVHSLQGYFSAPIKLTKFSFGTVFKPTFQFDELEFEINPFENINMATVFPNP